MIRADRELIGLLLLYAKSDRTDVTRIELMDLLRSLSLDLGERFIHEEPTEYDIQSSE